MKALSEGEAYGAQIAKQSGGLIKRGTVYGALKRMEGRAWVKSRMEIVSPSGRGRRRKMYYLTEYGEDALWSYTNLIERFRKLFEKTGMDGDLEWLNSTDWVKGF
jgi:DNA-binding PadR family transcriptional regulator